ncbi:YggS family pyridoxal phosphate-dependent enzyme [Nesterenkonia alkaliphila]|uniref:Pyridoxal phosphate homeostasis protein n=1 Tax=Nesterenkonia alkaliphila TaxID=1463631 RepID=A0A7K1UGC9_9MICC|nr:YggS family pyridoxal phosphate-dependent enzyme [Nesterenkonia alkaliphila]MVT25454.1 YggS family pyridoxal phosphate-dependent enzyme [Nesterenkonia alkaliphila]GFZ83829.1 YggS family pyridoxal phosphate enzyme [Nesterenkonia alkaliphila]
MDYVTAFRSAAENTEDPRTRQLALNLAAVHQRIDAAVEASGRQDRPELIVVTKYFPAEDVQRLHQLGVREIGENKDQEAAAKAAATGSLTQLRWHFIGQLQTNKAKSVARYAHSVHSADRAKLIRALGAATDRAVEEGHRDSPLEVLIQVDLRDPLPDDGRGGADPAQIPQLAEAIAGTEHLQLAGLMAVAPLGEEPAPAFARLQELSAELSAAHPQATAISAGMSQDLEPAVQYGATRLRIGRDVLGERPQH